MNDPRAVRFGTFEFEFASGELRTGGRLVPLQSQPAQVLAQLLNHPGQIVTREDLRRAVWGDDTFVEFDTALNVAINKIRQALRDSRLSPRFIETIPRRGYRFLAEVRPLTAPDAPSIPATDRSALPSPGRRTGSGLRPNRWLWAVALLVVVAGAAAWSGTRAGDPARDVESVAVLPFRPLVADARDEALEVGLAEAVIIRLGGLTPLRVPSIHAVQPYAQRHADARVAGRELGVNAVLEGSLLRANGNVRLSARLIDVAEGSTLWAGQWDLPWNDIFTVQDTIATEVSRALAIRLADAGVASKPHPTNSAAYERYLRARYLLLRRTVADSKRAAELLQEAVALDPASAAAHATLGFAHISVALLGGPTEPFVEAGRQAVRRALDLDPTIAEAHAVLGRILIHFDWDFEGGERQMRRALELGPADPFVLHCYSRVLADEGRFPEALALADRALAQDPASVLANRDKAQILFMARRYDECVEMCRRTLELDPYSPLVHAYLGRAYENLGRAREAVDAHIAPLALSEANRDTVATLRAAADRGGLKGFWQRRLQLLLDEREVQPYAVAHAFLQVGDRQRALDWLEKLYAARGGQIRQLKTNPDWDPLRGDPRFEDLLRRANLVPSGTSPSPAAPSPGR